MNKSVLVYMDEEDLDNWNNFKIICDEHANGAKTINDLLKAKNVVYSYLLNKYGVLMNKQIFVDINNKTILNLIG